MTTFGKTLSTGMAAALLLVAFTTGARGAIGGGVVNDRLDSIELRGRVVCTGCSLAEVRAARPDKWSNHLYRITYGQQQMVMEINWIRDSQRWNRLITTPYLQLRGADSLLEQLTAEANRFKEVEVSGILFSTQTLDLNRVTIHE